jgi:hypothetical protein
MLYTPMPGTPLHQRAAAEGRLLDDVDLADTHGQYKFNFRHPHISRDQSKTLLDRAFRQDFLSNGPSLYRLIRTMFDRWKLYSRDADPRIRARVAEERQQLIGGYGAALWAMEHYVRGSQHAVSARMRGLRLQMERDLGGMSRVVNNTLGPALLWTARREALRYPAGRALEPRTFIERVNWADS